jgi:hypothetical protein
VARFTDGAVTTREALGAYESSVGATAISEGIDVEQKIALAQALVGEDIEDFLRHEEVAESSIGSVWVSAGIVRWVEYLALELIFRDAFHSQLNDRYEAKLKRYEIMARAERLRVLESGVGIAGPTDSAPVNFVRSIRQVWRG